MPRRVYTYQPELGWATLNQIASAGAALMAIALLLDLANIVIALHRGEPAGDNPWQAPTLEWATASPPPPYNFEPLPTVSSREPLWQPDPNQPVVVGLASNKREVLVTHLMDAEPDHTPEEPGPTIWPFLAAIAVSVLFVWSIFTPWGVVYGSIPVFITLVGWVWPRSGAKPSEFRDALGHGTIRPREEML